ncbi:hypothetical protein, partial [Penaeicola halotolerans]|uniref:hypothetical protein n=1 Tax=Penaeicola halotolerans TaxID=2793196 RepID=UPI001CF8AA27
MNGLWRQLIPGCCFSVYTTGKPLSLSFFSARCGENSYVPASPGVKTEHTQNGVPLSYAQTQSRIV